MTPEAELSPHIRICNKKNVFFVVHTHANTQTHIRYAKRAVQMPIARSGRSPPNGYLLPSQQSSISPTRSPPFGGGVVVFPFGLTGTFVHNTFMSNLERPAHIKVLAYFILYNFEAMRTKESGGLVVIVGGCRR